MKILSESVIEIHTYFVDVEGDTYKYHEWLDTEDNSVLDATVTDMQDRDLNPELEEKLLDAIGDLVATSRD